MKAGLKRFLLAALVAAGASLPYLPALSGPFVFDDLNTIAFNPALKSLDLKRFFREPETFSTKTGNWPYRPLLVTVNALQFRFSGLSLRQWHGFQVFAHVLNSLLVVALAGRVFGLSKGAWLAGLLFAMSPLQTQAVNYLSARSMVLAGSLVLCALLLFEAGFASKGGRKAGTISGGILLGGASFFMSEAALSLLFFFVLCGWFRREGKPRGRDLVIVGVGLLGMALLYLSLRFLTEPVRLLEAHPRLAPSYTRMEHAFMQLRFPWLAARLFVLPLHLNFLHHAIPPRSLFDPRAFLPAAGLLLASGAGWRFRNRKPATGGAAWFFAALLPSVAVPLNIVWAEHRTYLALPGLVIFAGYALERLLEGKAGVMRQKARGLRFVVAFVFFCLFALCAKRSLLWASPLSLYRDAVKNSPGYDVPWNFLAHEYRARLEYEKALWCLDRAISLNPRFADAHSSRAEILVKLGRFGPALYSARKAVELDPENGIYWNNLGTVFMFLNRWEDAEKALREALRRTPSYDPNLEIIKKNLHHLQRKLAEKKSGSLSR